MRQYTVRRFVVETPEQLQALYDLKPSGNPSMLMLAQAWRAEKRRREQALLRTARRRPDLLAQLALTAKEKELIEIYIMRYRQLNSVR